MSNPIDLIKVYGDIQDLVRLGQDHDGGYVINKSALDESEVLYTYGVGWTYEFEKQYCSMFNTKSVFMYDPTIDLLDPKEDNINFFQLGLHGYLEGKTSFNAHLDINSHQNKKIFLKIDVEGHEYDFFKYVNLDTLKNVTGIAVEFHNLQSNFHNMVSIISKLKEVILPTHIHGNNHTPMMSGSNGFTFPSTVEVSFANKNLIGSQESVSRSYPLAGLDFPNAISLPDQEFKVYE